MSKTLLVTGAVVGLLMAGQAVSDHPKHKADNQPKEGVVVLTPTKGYKTRGVVRLIQENDHVRFVGTITGLTPGLKGFHVHEFGDMRSPDGTAAGSHYNPKGEKHGGLHDKERHAGDLGNIKADEKGVARIDIKAPGLTLQQVLGRSLIVHAEEDDLKSQPTGDSGPRAALGVIGVAKPAENEKTAH